MSLTVTMPQLGETVTEGTILSWAKQTGDSVVEDEVLVEISTDKVDTEMPSPASGVVTEILVAAGETVAVGTPIAVIGESMDAAAPAPEQQCRRPGLLGRVLRRQRAVRFILSRRYDSRSDYRHVRALRPDLRNLPSDRGRVRELPTGHLPG